MGHTTSSGAVHGLQIRLWSPEQIREWSGGEVTVTELLDWRTFRPVPGGLFCERIFGTTQRPAVVRDAPGDGLGRSDVRLDRMGHIELAAPVVDARFAQGRPSPIGLVLGMPPGHLDTSAEALHDLLRRLDLDELADRLRAELRSASGQRRSSARDRLWVVEAVRASGARPEWMVWMVLPVLPPSLRPIVQLDDSRYLVSNLNDLYRRVINRNNRLKPLLELQGVPEHVIMREKRLLQGAVDVLVGGWHKQTVPGPEGRPLRFPADRLRRWWS